MSFSDPIRSSAPDPDVVGSRKDTSFPTVEFTERVLLSGKVKPKRDDLGSTGEEEKEHLHGGGERWSERSAGGERRSEEKVEEAAM